MMGMAQIGTVTTETAVQVINERWAMILVVP
jgi:hypothetical protein